MRAYYDVPCAFPPGNDRAAVQAAVPGSKSITNRALLLAAMADGVSTLRGCMASEDAVHFLECIRTLGFPVTEAPAAAEAGRETALNKDITITGFGGGIPKKQAEIYVGSAGTAARFLVAMLALSDGEYVVRSSEQMQKRPMQPLIDALRAAGAKVECLQEEGHFPMCIRGRARQDEEYSLLQPSGQGGEKGKDSFSVNIDQSSQFLSALMIAAGSSRHPVEIRVEGSHGLSYVELTARMMRSFGVETEKRETDGVLYYALPRQNGYHAGEYPVEADMSAAAYFYALAALLGVSVTVAGVRREMLQGDVAFLKVLSRMGCSILGGTEEDLTLQGPPGGKLKGGFTVDMSAFSDQALTLAAIAPYADAPIGITGIAHIRLQECDRLKAIRENLSALGIRTEALEDGVRIYPGAMHGAALQTYEDHRVAMAFALCGLRTAGVRILDPDCCRKTFAEYFEVLDGVVRQLG